MNSLRRNAPVLAIAVGLSACLTLLLYAPALGLPFYSDDLLQVQWVKGTPLLDLWRTASPYGDYRPLHFTLWRLVYLLTGTLRPSALHILNAIGSILCSALVGGLALRARRSSGAIALMGTALFVAFPFAFDVVPWAVSFSYPLVVALALGAVLLYLRARRGGSRWAYGAALVLTVSAGLAYEPGIITGLLVVLAEATLVERPHYRRAFPYVVASMLPLLGVLAVGRAGSGLHFALPSAQDVGIGLQTLAYPVAPLAALLVHRGVQQIVALAVVAVPSLALLGIAAHRANRLQLFLFGLGWALLWTALPLITQHFDWMRDPPRVLYPSAAGTALVWAVGLASLVPSRLKVYRYAGAAVLGAAAVLPAALFVHSTVDVYARTGQLLWQVVREAESHSNALFVNLPGRVTSPGRFYPLGHEGFIPMPPPSNVSLLAEVNGGFQSSATARSMGQVLPSLPYGVELVGLPLSVDDVRAADRVFIGDYQAEGVTLMDAGGLVRAEQSDAALAHFGDALVLLSCSCERDADGAVLLSTRWKLLGPAPGSPTVFAHLLAPDGSLLAQADGDPLRGLFPIADWAPGDVVDDIRAFQTDTNGSLTVTFGVWDPTSGARWQATNANGERLPDDAFRCAVGQ